MDFQQATLKNGITILTIPLPYLESVALTVWSRVGSRYELKEQAGISHLFEHMVFKGGKKYKDAKAISEAIDKIGASSNAATSHEWTQFYVKSRAELIESAFDILGDMLVTPNIFLDDLERERGVVLEEISMKEDDPSDKISDLFTDLAFSGHPLAWDIAGYPQTVSSITRADLEAFHKTYYTGSNIIITVAGKFDQKEIINLATRYFGNLPMGERFEPIPYVIKKSESKINLCIKQTEQAHFILGHYSCARNDDRRYAEGILATVLGRGMSSRLFTEIREKRGLAYSVSTSVSRFIDTGIFLTYAGVDPARAKETMGVVLSEYEKISENIEPITKEEFIKAKEFAKGRLALGLEDTLAVNDFFGQRALFFENIQTPSEYIDMIEKVTIDEVQNIAQELFNPDNLRVSVIGPFESDQEFEAIVGK